MFTDLLYDHRVTVIGLCQKAAKFFFRVVAQDRKQNLASIDNEEWPVVGDEFGKERNGKKEKENPERPVAALVGPKVGKAAPIDRV